MKVQNNLQKCDNFWMKLLPTNYKLQITIYETKGRGERRQVEDPPEAHHLQLAHHQQPHEQLLSPLFVREFDHVPTRAGCGHPEPEGRVLHTVHAQDK